MIEVLPAPPINPGPSSRSVPRFVPVADKPQKPDKPKCPVCPRRFNVSSPFSICSVCKEKFHNSCIKKLKWGFSVPFTCRPCLDSVCERDAPPPPAHTSTARRPSAVSRAPPQSANQVAAPPSPTPTPVSASLRSDMDITLAAARASYTSVGPSYVLTPPPYTTPEPVLTPPPSTPPSLCSVTTPALPTIGRADTVLTEPNPVPPSPVPTTPPRPNVVQQCLNQPKLSLDLGEFFLNSRLLEEKFRRCPGQRYSPRDMNCGPHALLHQLCSNPVYDSAQLYHEDDHAVFRRMVCHHFSLQVIILVLIFLALNSSVGGW